MSEEDASMLRTTSGGEIGIWDMYYNPQMSHVPYHFHLLLSFELDLSSSAVLSKYKGTKMGATHHVDSMLVKKERLSFGSTQEINRVTLIMATGMRHKIDSVWTLSRSAAIMLCSASNAVFFSVSITIRSALMDALISSYILSRSA